MPYSLPSTGRPTHRRSFSAEQGPGAFASLGSLPRRTPATAKFHIEEQESESDEETQPPPLKLKIHRVPFPRSSPTPSPVAPPPPPEKDKLTPPQRPTPTRTSSSPILLSNGKPLKSSLKSSNSAPSIFSHLRARSEPATPTPEMLTPSTPKNVHFPSQNLESVRVFNRSAKPASLLSASETETETEQESGWTLGGFVSGSLSRGFPFPRISSPPPPATTETEYILDLSSNPVPNPNPDVYTNVFLESLSLSPSSLFSAQGTQRIASKDLSGSLYLHGTLLLRNISYEKHASVRFTLDEWDTTSEVGSRYIDSPPEPPTFLLPRTFGDLTATQNASFDRFGFSIRLSDYLPQSHSTDIPLLKKRLFMAIKYTVPGKGEWWDNCGGSNWRVAFRSEESLPPTPSEDTSSSTRERSVSAPAVVVNAPNTFLENVVTPTAPATAPPLHERGYSEGTAKALQARLSKFRLMNYAAPKGKVTFPSPAAPPSPLSSPSITPSVKEREGYPFPSPPSGKTSPRYEGVLWPWGHQPSSPTKSNLAEPVLTPPVVAQKGDESPLTPPPTPPVPSLSLPPLPALERSRSNSTSSDESFDGVLGDLGVIEVPPPPLPPSTFSSKQASTNPMESDMLYKAFVREWCFGYSSSSSTATTSSARGVMERSVEGSFMGVEV